MSAGRTAESASERWRTRVGEEDGTGGEGPEPRSGDEVVVEDCDHILDRAADAMTRLAGGRILITGGAGFLGHYLVQALLRWNELVPAADAVELTVADVFHRGQPGWLTPLRESSGLRLLRHDVTRPLPEGTGEFDWIVHAASIASPTYYRRHPIETMDANVQGLRRLLDRTVERSGGKGSLRGLLFLSSSEIYGDPPPERIPTPETYRGNVSCTGPRACYDESKRFGETLCVNFARVHGLPIRTARPFNNYGPGLTLTDRRVVPDFARDILAGRDIVMHSDGSPTRTFCYVADAIAGYLKVLTLGRNGEAYNIGTEAPEVSILELAERMATLGREVLGYEGGVVRRPAEDPEYLADNPSRRRPDITKARRELDYQPDVSLREGLRRSLLWYRDSHDAQEADR